MSDLTDADSNEIQEALAFTRNFKGAGSKMTDTTRGSSCDTNCDCYVETEYTTAAGIAGYRYGS